MRAAPDLEITEAGDGQVPRHDQPAPVRLHQRPERGEIGNAEYGIEIGPRLQQGTERQAALFHAAGRLSRIDQPRRPEAKLGNRLAIAALAIEAAGSTETAAINAKIREVSNPEGTKVYSYAEGKEALKKGKINFEGASSVLDFDQYGDVSPSFGVFFIEGGKLNRRYVVNI